MLDRIKCLEKTKSFRNYTSSHYHKLHYINPEIKTVKKSAHDCCCFLMLQTNSSVFLAVLKSLISFAVMWGLNSARGCGNRVMTTTR